MSLLLKPSYMALSEQYYYHVYGSDILKNTSFSFPQGPFCISSDLINEYTGSNNSYKVAESHSNHLVTYTSVAYSVPAIVFTVIIGPIMDRMGRKIGIIFPIVGMVSRLAVKYLQMHSSLPKRNILD